MLKKQNHFEWTDECQQDLKDLKSYLSNPPLLAKPKDGERLLIYLVVLEVAISAVLVREDKVVLPLRNILRKHELSDRLAKWAIELSEYDIIYQPRTVIKSQVLAYFVADFGMNLVPGAKKELQVFTGANPGTWTLFTDTSSNVKGAGLEIILIPPSGEVIRQAIKCYLIINNEAEYEAVIAGLELYGILPEDKKKSQLLRQKAAWYCLIRGNLYRKRFGGPLARCLGPSQTKYVMREVHEGHYSNHVWGRSLVKTLIRSGYYWSKMEEEAENVVVRCDKCQRYANNMYRLVELLHLVISPWPFMKWGMDIVRSLPQAKGKVQFMLVLTDYFSKWVEVGAFKQVREKEVRDFIWKNIICQFGVPKKIVCDNGPQFKGAKITEFFQSWQIKRITSAPYHPAANGQDESTNKVIIINLKKRFEESKSKWPEIGEPSTRYTHATEEENKEELRVNLDLLEDRREVALIRKAAQKHMIEQYYNRKANLRYFKIGDFVLKKEKDQKKGVIQCSRFHTSKL
uniref:Integrase catalytic domain-containing protein n=1 Tax=Nicotiana tabacum TaxID=4097 RepID=A0A1S4A5P0_TOBAC|nr:PREDICTED: uncharacterized protein LOC107793997 [Nicotiana tabacum]